jgi:hypothetical protein
MGITKIKRCDFVIHTMKDIVIINVDFDEQVWDALKGKALEVFKTKVVPCLIEKL